MSSHPSYSADKRREYQRAYRAAGKDRHVRQGANRNLPFQGFDGEGGNSDSGYHSYFLCSSGRQSIVPRNGNTRLTTYQCLEFIASLPPNRIHVVYYGDYDFTKILEDLPLAKLDRLMDRDKRRRKDGRGVWPVDYGDFELDYLSRKYFKVRRILDGGGRSQWVEISDVGSFFQCKFVEALEIWDIGTPEEREFIRENKELRGSFTQEGLEEITRYNLLEISLLERLMSRFRDACIAAGVLPRKWQGPGLLAEALYEANNVPPTREVSLLTEDTWVNLLLFARNAYYGGRPEIMAVGPVAGPVWQWDINSAYPYAMLSVPCLQHGTWEEVTDGSGLDEEYSIVYGSFEGRLTENGKRPFWYGLPVRGKDGSIFYPEKGRGWYWSFEVRASTHQVFSVEKAWIYRKACACQPLSFVRDVYQERRRLGKDGPGIVLKLALNSLYGKTVQSIGSPKFANPIWGSFITAHTRRLIQEFIHGSPECKEGWCGSDVLMVATDSVCTNTNRHDMEDTKELGGWSRETHHEGMFIVQPGLYFGSSGKRAKTRGVPLTVISEYRQVFENAFRNMVETGDLSKGDVQVPQQLFCGIRYALHRRNLKLLGQWVTFTDPDTQKVGKTIRFDWTSKRAAWPVLGPKFGIRTHIATFPHRGSDDVDSVPYSKDIGGVMSRTLLRELLNGQPDTGPEGFLSLMEELSDG